MSSLAEVIGWKFSHAPGMTTRGGKIVRWPPGLPDPTPENIAAWTAEYEARDLQGERIDAAFPQTDVARVIFEALFELSNRVIALEGGNAITRGQLRDWLKAKLP